MFTVGDNYGSSVYDADNEGTYNKRPRLKDFIIDNMLSLTGTEWHISIDPANEKGLVTITLISDASKIIFKHLTV